jgi:hypothetical protein
MKRILAVLLAAGAVVGFSTAAGAAGLKIGPNQLFAGSVNGRRAGATIMMACFGPERPGQTGHPLPDQTVSVQPSVDISGGNTGASAHRIVVDFVTPATTQSTITFHRYGTRLIPTSLTLPCSGAGAVAFVPEPSSGTSRADVIRVTFVPQP